MNNKELIKGIALGAVVPAILYSIFFLIQQHVELYIKTGFIQILCIGANGLIFRFFIKKEDDELSKGVLVSTIIYALLYFWIKIF